MDGIFREERIFVEAFVAALRYKGTKEFLFSDQSYVRKLSKVFDRINELTADCPVFSEISTLQAKRPIFGDFARFNTVLLGLIGSRIQMLHRLIQISMNKKLANSILNERCPFPREQMLEIAKIFQIS